mmetsp:Transcript_10006/g.12977  ORF Transcript_10006/g.12977 Transcript_10006/m.12977 type:complete len:422 (+) Transcript_10006:35-1300(+)
MPSCLDLAEVPECGFKGVCLSQNGGDHTCFCEEGWSRPAEFLFVVEETLQDEAPCVLNNAVVQLLYGGLVIISGSALFLEIISFRMKNQLLTLYPQVISFVCVFSSALIRSLNDNTYFGENVLFSFLCVNAVGFYLFSSVIYLNKYLLFLRKKIYAEKFTPSQRHRMWLVKRLNKFSVLYDFSLNQLLWIAAFPKSSAVKRVLFRMGLTLFCVRCLSHMVYSLIILGGTITDMKNMIEGFECPHRKEREEDRKCWSHLKEHQNVQNCVSWFVSVRKMSALFFRKAHCRKCAHYFGDESDDHNRLSEETRCWIYHNLGRIRRKQIRLVCNALVLFFFSFTGIYNDFWVLLFTYFYPIMWIFVFWRNFSELQVRWNLRNARYFNTEPKVKSKESLTHAKAPNPERYKASASAESNAHAAARDV